MLHRLVKPRNRSVMGSSELTTAIGVFFAAWRMERAAKLCRAQPLGYIEVAFFLGNFFGRAAVVVLSVRIGAVLQQ